MSGVDERAADLAVALAGVVGVDPGDVTGLRRLSGGASRETWAFDANGRPLILQRERKGSARTAGMRTEAALLRAAGAEGVPVPGVVATAGDEPDALGPAWMVVDRVDGETIARKILRDDEFAAARPVLAAQCGEALAGIHRIAAASVPDLHGGDQVAQLRATLDAAGEPHPAFELGFRWLDRHRPPAVGARDTVVHGDFRNGNLVVGPDGLRAVLDWELAHGGDPLEDLGWLCVRAWRFGAEPRVGGFGTVDELVGAYEAASGEVVDRAALHWWEVLGTLKWGIICVLQAYTHLSGMVRSVELAAIGRRVCEVEHDLLVLLPGPSDESVPAPHDAPHGGPARRGRARVPRGRRDGRDRGPGAVPRPGRRHGCWPRSSASWPRATARPGPTRPGSRPWGTPPTATWPQRSGPASSTTGSPRPRPSCRRR